ncbi:hypothetical protein ACFVMC_30520 [Nocardia sp. NPDC127579]|uniref:hypothetical protein n=1 Tax=Nocardia sp. NPDC127579 TaxID=3345402 RepID=UPI00363DAD06
MAIAEARIPTGQAARFFRQFCKHASAMGSPRAYRMRFHGGDPAAHGAVRTHGDCSDDDTGTIVLDPRGRCELRADDGVLTIRCDHRRISSGA